MTWRSSGAKMRAATTVRFSPSKLYMLRTSNVVFVASTVTRRTFTSGGSKLATWGFVGLGRMGYPMAMNLRARLPASDTLVIYDQNTEATSRFLSGLETPQASIGTEVGEVSETKCMVKLVNSPREVAERSHTIITVLPEPSHVKIVFHNILNPPLPAITQERLFIDCSTIDPASSREVANAVHHNAQGRFVDAPMSGGVLGARTATLTFMLGASSRSGALVARATAALQFMGRKVVYLGEQGMGLSAKLANNYLLAITNIAVAEAMHLGLRSGLDAVKLGQLINSSSGRCWSSEVNNPVPGISPNAPVEDDYEGGFSVELMRKDLRLAVEAAGVVGARLELAGKATEVYEHVEAEHPGRDFSVVYQWLEDKD